MVADHAITEFLDNEHATVAAGQELGEHLQAGMTVFLEGTLGAGKTTFTRGVLNAFGHSGAVKSPTYTLVENYEGLSSAVIYHFDLYRLGDPEELEYMGIRDYFSAQSICMVEWAERGQGVLPTPDIVVNLSMANSADIIGRKLTIASHTALGQNTLQKWRVKTH